MIKRDNYNIVHGSLSNKEITILIGTMIVNLSLKETVFIEDTKVEIIPYWELV